MIDPSDLLVKRARANRLLLRLTWLAIAALLAFNVDYILERL